MLEVRIHGRGGQGVVTAAELLAAAAFAEGRSAQAFPSFRLARDVLDAEVDRIAAMGVTLELSHPVPDAGAALREEQPGVFAGGDMVPSPRTVTAAVGHGKRAARHIDCWLRSEPYGPPPRHPLASFERLNTWYYSDAPATVRPVLDAARRVSTFDEVVGGLDEASALFEARRCLSCGNCFECDNCFGVCPDNAVVKLGPGGRYAIDLDFCKGCGICVTECPCGAIDLIPEQT